MNAKVLIKSLLVAKSALENARKFVQRNGSEDDSNLNHDALYHVEHCLNELQQEAARENKEVSLHSLLADLSHQLRPSSNQTDK